MQIPEKVRSSTGKGLNILQRKKQECKLKKSTKEPSYAVILDTWLQKRKNWQWVKSLNALQIEN